MSAVTHVGTVIVPVADQDAARAFYTGTLGFEVRIDAPFPGGRWLEVAPPGAADMSHREIARRLAAEQGADLLAWNVQAVVGSYERARKGRQVGEHEDGFTVTASKTVAVPIERLYAAFVDADERARWLPGAELRERTTIEPRSARFDWGDGPSRIHVSLTAKGDAKTTAALTHERLPDSAEAARMKVFWRDRVAGLKEVLEA